MRDRIPTRRDFLASLAAGLAASSWCAAARGASPADAAGAWKIGCYTRPWDDVDYRAALDGIAEAGFEYAGLMTTVAPRRLVISAETTPEEAASVALEIRKRKLSVLSVYGGDSWLKPSREDSIAGFKRLIDRCAACRSGNLLLGGTGNADALDTYVAAIAEVAGYAADKGVHLSIKPHGGLNADGPQLRRLIERVNHPNFRAWFDPANILYYSDGRLDPVEQAGHLDGLVTGVCIKDFLPPKNVTVTPGAGRVDFKAVFARLAKGGFKSGPLVIECLAPKPLAERAPEARAARRFLRDLLGLGP